MDWEILYTAALENDSNEVAYQLTAVKNWVPKYAAGNELIGDYKLTKLSPIYAAVINPTKNSGEIAYKLAAEACKIGGISITKDLIHTNILAAAYKLLTTADPDQREWVRKLVQLAIKNGALREHLQPLFPTAPIKNPTLSIFKEFYKLRQQYPYTVAKIYFDIISNLYNISAVINLLGYKPNTVPIKDLSYIIKIWTLFGTGPSPYQVRKIIVYDNYEWGADRVNAIIETLIRYGYDFNAKYISQTSNEPVYFSLFKVDPGYLIDLILTGRIDTELKSNNTTIDGVLSKLKNADLTSAVNAWRYVKNTSIVKLCKAKNLDKFQKQARLHALKNIAYQLQLKKTGNVTTMCKCIDNIISAEKQDIFPYQQIMDKRKNCSNEYALSMAPIKEVSSSQLIIFEDTSETLESFNVHPRYCFDKGSIKELLKTGINPYTNVAFPDSFTDELLDVPIVQEAMELSESVGELTRDGKLPVEPPVSDFHQMLGRFEEILRTVNPYLNYEVWATQYLVEDYSRSVPNIGFDGFVQTLDLHSVKVSLPVEQYVTQLMGILINRIESAQSPSTAIALIIGAVMNMLQYIPVHKNLAEIPADVDPYANMTKDELTAKKNMLTKEFVAGGMTDKSLMNEIQNIRQRLTAMD